MKAKTPITRKGWSLFAKMGVGILVLILLAGIIVDAYLNQFIASHLKNKVSASTKGLYSLDFKKVDVNVFSRKIRIQGAELHLDSSIAKKMLSAKMGSSFLLEGNFPTIELDEIHWIHLIFSKNLIAGVLTLHSPDVILSKLPTDSMKTESSAHTIDDINIHSIHVDDANLEFRSLLAGAEHPTVHRLRKIKMDINGLMVNKDTVASQMKLPFKKVEMLVGSYEYRTADSLYLMGFHDLQYSSENNELKVAQIYIRPRLSEKDYAHKLPYQKERNDISFENVKVEDLNPNILMEQGDIDIKSILVGSGHWNLSLNRIPPLPPVRKKVVPSQPLLDIPLGISIDTMHVNKFQLQYHEYNPATQETGEVKFNDINGKVTNITNKKSLIEKNPHLVANLDARLMGAGNFKATFDFLLSDSTGSFSVDARLGKMPAELLNPGFIPLNKVEIKKGTIDELHCTGSGNESSIHGNVSLLYHDLHIAVMEKDKQADTMKAKTVVSVVANILVKNDNPKKDEPVRMANNITLKRDSRKSYFNMLWMALFTGIVKIASGK